MKHGLSRVILAMMVVMTIAALAPSKAWADPDSTNCLYPSPTDRFGITVRGDQEITWFDVSPLTIGRYLNWRWDTYPARPNAMDYYFMVRVRENFIWPSASVLKSIARVNPGATWIVGNEADVIHQDNTTPGRYARAYHEVYTAIKSVDPTARFVANGIVMVSPLRLAWLNEAWNTYRTLYGTDMPVDVWNVHTYIANEMHQQWGFEIPPGFPNAVGYSLYLGTEWSQANDAGASGGTVHESRIVDAKAYFAFRGNQVTVFLRTGPDAGIAQIYLDHSATPVEEVDLYAPARGTLTRTYSNLTPPGGLLQDRHNIRVQVTGRKNEASSNTWIRVDAIQAPSTADLPGGRFEDNNPLRATILTWVDDHDNLEMVAQQIRDFRQWMAANGQRNKPLINTEYGILMSEALGFTYPRVRTFMLNSFDRFLYGMIDPNLGYPADDNRMLQEWFWWALAVITFEGQTTNSGLYNPWTRAIRPLGQDFANYVQPLAVNYVDLQLDTVAVTPYWPIFAGGDATLRIEPRVRNRGNLPSGPFNVRVRYGNGTLLTSWPFSGLPKRFEPGYMVNLRHDWRTSVANQYSVRVIVDEANQVAEPCNTNNEMVVEVTRPQGTDLALSNLRTDPTPVPAIPAGATTTVTLRVDLLNLGGVGTSASQVQVTFWSGDPDAGGQQIGVQTIPAGNLALPAMVSFQWPGRSRGWYQVFARVEPVPEEQALSNNTQSLTFLVPGSTAFLPNWQRGVQYGQVMEGLDIPEARQESSTPPAYLLPPEQ